ncbi:MAG: Uma2 family endonuclease [Pyrinomonadaceae bacterium]
MNANPQKKHPHFYSEREYIALEKAGDARYEYRDGEVVCMSGGTLNHYRIERNIFALLHNELKERGCESFTADTPVKSPIEKYYRYPDASIVCGEVMIEKVLGIDCLANPIVLVEVLSPDSEDEDRNAKRKAYQAIPTLREYLLVAQDSAHGIHYSKQGDLWQRREAADLSASVELSSIGVRLRFEEIYSGVVFE